MVDPDSLPRFSATQLRLAVQSLCSCGGSGPGEGCLACDVWHFMQDTPTSDDRVVQDAPWWPEVGTPYLDWLKPENRPDETPSIALAAEAFERHNREQQAIGLSMAIKIVHAECQDTENPIDGYLIADRLRDKLRWLAAKVSRGEC